ncbi:hypothetical protein B7L70_09680 [Vulcanisaeta sp. EB80]|uniref:hypothetical protein n=1 Tax=Vulcanisaeta sp. EB80 TaxID=1650660 RepID=UPI0009C1448A|nr:hypothetical protein [Vulcanisaeta sp. EB80]PLC66897.1 hypothetical protein B7L70_09680 [Vulcanisaeta sp. EB80]
MSAVSETVIGVIIVAMAATVLGVVFYILTGYQTGFTHQLEAVTTLVAGVETEPNTWIVEVVWTYKPVIKGFITSDGRFISVDSGQVSLLQCGVGYAPAPYRYCIYRLEGVSKEPVEVVG